MGTYRHLTALGSSFAAGPGIPPYENAAAMRSTGNYPHLLAASLGLELTDLSVSGATTVNILDTAQVVETYTATPQTFTFEPQMAGLTAESDVVTITAGGNDLEFIGSMLYTGWNREAPAGPIATLLRERFAGGIPEPRDDDIERAARGLVNVVEAVRERASGARVVLVDYLTVVTEGTPDAPESPFTATELRTLLSIQRGLASAYVLAAERTGAELLRVSELSAEHAIGSEEPWVFGFAADLRATPRSFHPNPQGMQAVATALERLLAG